MGVASQAWLTPRSTAGVTLTYINRTPFYHRSDLKHKGKFCALILASAAHLGFPTKINVIEDSIDSIDIARARGAFPALISIFLSYAPFGVELHLAPNRKHTGKLVGADGHPYYYQRPRPVPMAIG